VLIVCLIEEHIFAVGAVDGKVLENAVLGNSVLQTQLLPKLHTNYADAEWQRQVGRARERWRGFARVRERKGEKRANQTDRESSAETDGADHPLFPTTLHTQNDSMQGYSEQTYFGCRIGRPVG
jgi:hypothetical protein